MFTVIRTMSGFYTQRRHIFELLKNEGIKKCFVKRHVLESDCYVVYSYKYRPFIVELAYNDDKKTFHMN